MQFIVDSMLGKLARWLRVLGYDTLYDVKMDDEELIKLAKTQDRMLVTRDQEICKRKNIKTFLIKSTRLSFQLEEIMQGLSLSIKKNLMLTRCLACNGLLQEEEKGKIKDLIPELVFDVFNEFWRCQECGKIYWKGSHWEKMLSVTLNLFQGLRNPDSTRS